MEEKVIVKKPPKSPFLAGMLAFFFPFGVAPLYNRQTQKAVVHFLILAATITMLSSGYGNPVFLGLFLGAFYFYQLIDSVNTASAINRSALSGDVEETDSEKLPEVIKTGSVFWGIILMFLGIIFLLANFEIVIDYAHIFDLWPLIIIVVGVKLLVDFFMKNKQEI